MAVPLKHILYRTVGRHFGNKVTTYISILRLVYILNLYNMIFAPTNCGKFKLPSLGLLHVFL